MRKFLLLIILLIVLCTAANAQPGQNPVKIPKITVGVDQTDSPEDTYITLQILLLITILSLAPGILIMMTSFTRIIIVFHFLRQAVGTQQVPPNQVMITLALFLTFFIMKPTVEQINTTAIQPYLQNQINQQQALEKAVKPIRKFMFKHTREDDLGLFVKMSADSQPASQDDVPTLTLIPAFALSELRMAFQIGFMLFLPFLIIDIIIASILMSMGMFMLPPMMISMPFKIMLFVLVDGWYLLISSMLDSF